MDVVQKLMRDADLGAQTCIALRTMVVKDGVAYLQAGVGSLHS